MIDPFEGWFVVSSRNILHLNFVFFQTVQAQRVIFFLFDPDNSICRALSVAIGAGDGD